MTYRGVPYSRARRRAPTPPTTHSPSPTSPSSRGPLRPTATRPSTVTLPLEDGAGPVDQAGAGTQDNMGPRECQSNRGNPRPASIVGVGGMGELREVVILEAARTPIGRFMGGLSTVAAPRLASAATAEAVRRAHIPPERVNEVYMGIILAAGLGQAPARQASIYAGLRNTVPATTLNKIGGPGPQAVMLGAQAIQAGDADIIVAGGMENMSAAPYLLDRARAGYRIGHGTLVDSMIKDGLWDVYTQMHMGNCAELLAREYKISRAEQDEFARRSYSRALEAMDSGHFRREIVPIEVPGEGGAARVVAEDEEPRRYDPSKLAALRPVFEEGGTVTAANASSISDGAAALVLAAADVAREFDARPLARIVGQAVVATAPEWFTIAPAGAIRRLLSKIGWTKETGDR